VDAPVFCRSGAPNPPGGVGIVAKNSYPGQVRRDLLEEIQPFSAETEHDRHRARELLDCCRPLGARDEDDIRRQRE